MAGNFKHSADIERWLTNKSREAAIAIAARAALRVIPALAPATEPIAKARWTDRLVILPAMRAAAAPWVATKYPAYDADVRGASASAARAADAALADMSAYIPPGDSSYPAAFASSSASRAASASRTVDAAFASAQTCSHAIDAAYAAGYSFAARTTYARDAADLAAAGAIAASSLDADAIDSGVSPEMLAGRPLWLDEIPVWARVNWQVLRDALLGANAHWDIWIEWYEARLHGEPAIEHIEGARVMIADDIWRQVPKNVNLYIKRLTDESEIVGTDFIEPETDQRPPIEAVPIQIPHALVFGGSESEPMGLIDPPGEGVTNTSDQRQGHSDIREKAALLEAACGTSNRLAVLKGYVVKLVIAAGVTLLDLQVRAFWSQMNSLRRRVEADDRARRLSDPEDPPLADEVAGLLRDLVDTLNVFAAHEPKLVVLDELKRDPAERLATEEKLVATREIADAARAMPQAVYPYATEALTQVMNDASGSTPSSDRAKEFSIKSARNLVLEAIRRSYKAVLSEPSFAWKGVREGAYRAAGATGATYMAAVLIKNNETAVRVLIDTLGGSTTLHRIVDLIVKTLS